MVAIPVAPARADIAKDLSAAAAHPTMGDAAPAPGVRLDGLRALVVEDGQDARELLASILSAAGATVEAVAGADEALEALEREKFGVLVSDIGMPGKDGYALIQEVRRRGFNGRLPAIALTAYARAEDRQKALLSGFNFHLTKPVEPAELIVVVAALVRRN